ncbi:hypothetical protein L0U95_31900 (plasmid) [Burkholderia cenocepacia]|uniref:hypothetical protein n=1 Tax=Burkholderia cenocepacia TaxID=95486 RepID=UPI001F29EB98|nr:hypothetical protein [Burkholderia cenocepacia]UJH78373.1 hypothetical protein L0U95_31900 [Burkholderia cenocepacia]
MRTWRSSIVILPCADGFGEHERQHLPAISRHYTQRQVRQPVQARPALHLDIAPANRVCHAGPTRRAGCIVVERERGHADEQIGRTRDFREHDRIGFADRQRRPARAVPVKRALAVVSVSLATSRSAGARSDRCALLDSRAVLARLLLY